MAQPKITSGMRWFVLIFGALLMLISVGLLFVTFSAGVTKIKWDEFSLSTPYPGLMVLFIGMLVFALAITGQLGFGGSEASAKKGNLPPAVTDQAAAINKLVDLLADKSADKEYQPQPLSPELRAAAEQVLQRGAARDKARAAIALRKFKEADQYLAEAMKPALSDVFELLTIQGDRHYFADEFDRAIEPYEKAFKLIPDNLTARNNLAITHNQAHLGNCAEHRHRALDIHEGTLKLITQQDHPLNWAMTQDNLGNVWAKLPTGNRADNIQRAIKCHQNAIQVYSRQNYPVDWAITQNNLGAAWNDLSTGDRATNLKKTIGCFQQSLEILTPDAFPHHNVTINRNLAKAKASLQELDENEA